MGRSILKIKLQGRKNFERIWHETNVVEKAWYLARTPDNKYIKKVTRVEVKKGEEKSQKDQNKVKRHYPTIVVDENIT